LGLVQRVPKLIAAQPSGSVPVARAFAFDVDEVSAWNEVNTTVSGLDDPLRGYVAGLLKIGHTQVCGPSGTVVCLLTGHGMKRIPPDSFNAVRVNDEEAAV
jgi:hypothetical protein